MHFEAFKKLIFLETLKISQTSLNSLNTSILDFNFNIKELDLSFNKIIWNADFENLTILKLESVYILTNQSKFTLNPLLVSLDFSQNDQKINFSILNTLFQVETLVLRQIKLYSVSHINFNSFSKLKK